MERVIRRHRDREAFVHALHLQYSPRVHAAILLAAAAILGWLVSKLFLWAGMTAPWIRFPLAVLYAYVFFLVFVDLWLRFLGLQRGREGPSIDGPAPEAVSSSRSEASTEPWAGEGGSFDGGGASGDFDAPVSGARAVARVSAETKAQGAVHGVDVAEGTLQGAALAGEFLPVALFVLALGALAVLGGWLFAATPILLVEVAIEAALAAGLIRTLGGRRASAEWFLLERTFTKGLFLVFLAFVLGLAVRWAAPGASTIGEAATHLMGR